MSVSVVIPCYCCDSTIIQAVDSVCQQSYLPLEIILIDDASIDDTLNRLESLKQKYTNLVKLIYLEKNVGVSAARNKGVLLAKGDFIAFLDADDVWHPQKLALQLEAMLQENAGLSGHLYQATKNESFEHNIVAKSSKLITYSVPDMLISNRIATPTVIIKKSYFVPFDERLKRCEDWKCWVEIMVSNNTKILFLPIVLSAGGKPSLGSGGLSADVGAMHLDMLRAITYLVQSKHVSYLYGLIACVLEQIKYPLRLIKLKLFKYLKVMNVESA